MNIRGRFRPAVPRAREQDQPAHHPQRGGVRGAARDCQQGDPDQGHGGDREVGKKINKIRNWSKKVYKH